MTPTNRNRKSNTSTTANNNKNASTVTLPRRVDCFKQQQQNYLLKLISIDLSGLYYVDRMQFFTKKMRSVAWLKACVMWYRWPKNHQKYHLKCTALPMSSIHFFSPLLSYEMANEFLILKYMIVRIVLWFVCAWGLVVCFQRLHYFEDANWSFIRLNVTGSTKMKTWQKKTMIKNRLYGT